MPCTTVLDKKYTGKRQQNSIQQSYTHETMFLKGKCPQTKCKQMNKCIHVNKQAVCLETEVI